MFLVVVAVIVLVVLGGVIYEIAIEEDDPRFSRVEVPGFRCVYDSYQDVIVEDTCEKIPG